MKIIDKLLSSESRQEELFKKEEKKINSQINSYEKKQNSEYESFIQSSRDEFSQKLKDEKSEIDTRATSIVQRAKDEASTIDYSNLEDELYDLIISEVKN